MDVETSNLDPFVHLLVPRAVIRVSGSSIAELMRHANEWQLTLTAGRISSTQPAFWEVIGLTASPFLLHLSGLIAWAKALVTFLSFFPIFLLFTQIC